MAKDVFTGWLQTLDTERLERVHAEVVDQLDLIERELGRRVQPGPDARVGRGKFTERNQGPGVGAEAVGRLRHGQGAPLARGPMPRR